MTQPKKIKISIAFLILISSTIAFSQESSDTDAPVNNESKKGFHVGLYVGSYFANKYTAGLYDGYGFDIDGNKNSFENSFMYNKIINQYGGQAYSGQVDQIANELKVDQYTGWTFNQTDMPTDMHYNPAFMVGLNTRYSVDNKNAILFNVNAAKLAISGHFTIMTAKRFQSGHDSVNTFNIRGGEQRLQLQFGYQRILGSNEKINFVVEGGMNMTLAKFDKNEILINNLKIDLVSYNNTAYYATPGPVKKPIGVGFGLFAGAGAIITMSPKWTVELIYNPTYEGIKLGANPRLKWQQGVGLRAYYIL
jgi:hypothetical protein